MTPKNQLSKIRDYDRHKSRACVDLFLKVTRSSILTIIINRDEIFDYVILSDRFLWYTLWEIGKGANLYRHVCKWGELRVRCIVNVVLCSRYSYTVSLRLPPTCSISVIFVWF